jgi:hypothetical protein
VPQFRFLSGQNAISVRFERPWRVRSEAKSIGGGDLLVTDFHWYGGSAGHDADGCRRAIDEFNHARIISNSAEASCFVAECFDAVHLIGKAAGRGTIESRLVEPEFELERIVFGVDGGDLAGRDKFYIVAVVRQCGTR